MLPDAFNDCANSPTLLISPQPQQDSFGAASRAAHTFRYYSFEAIMPKSTTPKSSNDPESRPSSTPPTEPTPSPIPIVYPLTTAGMLRGHHLARKRTRDEDEDLAMNQPSSRTPAISPDSVLGTSVPRTDPLTGEETTTEGRSGMSKSMIEGELHGKLGHEQTNDAMDVQQDRPDSACEDNGFSRRKAQRRVSPPNVDATSASMDPFTRRLGQGWTEVGQDAASQASARGWTRYIERNYAVTNPEILSRSDALESFLVRTNEGFYLFRDDLSGGRLISTDFDDAAARLQYPNGIQYPGMEIMRPNNGGEGSSTSVPDPDTGMDVDG